MDRAGAGWRRLRLGLDLPGGQGRNLPRPDSVDELRELLIEHLDVEADDPAAYIRLGEHALRVRTDDDEVDLAYYFVADGAAAASPDRLAFLLHDTWPLPSGAAPPAAAFSHGVPVRPVRPTHPGPDSVFSVRLCWESPDTHRNLDLACALVFPGLTLPDLAAHLGGVDDSVARSWPHDARLLRAMVAPGEEDTGAALERYARLPGYEPSPVGIGRVLEHAVIHREVLELLRPERPVQSSIRLDAHIAQAARYIDEFFGFDQWFLFDTRWAAAHPDLARSLLRYAAHWDPYEA